MKLKNSLGTKAKVAVSSAATALASMMTAVTAHAATFNAPSNLPTVDGIMKGVVGLFSTIGVYGGALYAIVAIFTLILAIRNEDNEGRNKAILNLLAAIALLSFGAILKLFGF